ncbi:serine hydrolase domain-containing protein [Marinivivus vitaminiproducens]|uniref:serine hydrolase domain-containing protein n=1 Tax=Marinivivus vitaminiproducens TaxID=3035935 RepID=UPI00279BE843|nr:serine hydrolase [Geminicoccaceae bacterium SCSIO 64248]
MTASDARLTADLDAAFDSIEARGLLKDVHACLIVKDGQIVLERYVDGEDFAWGRPLGRVAFGPDTLHDLRSVTKSIVGLLYGIALDRGEVPGPDAPLLDAFPDCADLAHDPARARWRVGHALTMTLGTAWSEDAPYTSSANSEIAMEMADDRFRYILDRPILSAPGERWIYNGGATALLGHVIAQGSGRPLDVFARDHLFAPLGIDRFEWTRGRDGAPSAASGLRLAARDLVRIGSLVAQDGLWQGRTIVGRAWLEQSLKPAVPVDAELRYGRHWYLGAQGPIAWVAAMGNGGQRLVIVPRHGLVMALFAGAYDRPDQVRPAAALMRDAILPALAR